MGRLLDEDVVIKEIASWREACKDTSHGYTCNDCYLSMQNCHDMSICCEDETGLCDWFEEIPEERRTDG